MTSKQIEWQQRTWSRDTILLIWPDILRTASANRVTVSLVTGTSSQQCLHVNGERAKVNKFIRDFRDFEDDKKACFTTEEVRISQISREFPG